MTGDYFYSQDALERAFLRRIGIDNFKENVILGGHYISPRAGPGDYPHNLFIETASSMGVVGLVALSVMTIRVVIALSNPGFLYSSCTGGSALAAVLHGCAVCRNHRMAGRLVRILRADALRFSAQVSGKQTASTS